jgi:hypothetical protein
MHTSMNHLVLAHLDSQTFDWMTIYPSFVDHRPFGGGLSTSIKRKRLGHSERSTAFVPVPVLALCQLSQSP